MPRRIATCNVHYVKAACEGPGDAWSWEGSKAGVTRCRSLGFIKLAAKNGRQMTEGDIDEAIEKDETLVFMKP